MTNETVPAVEEAPCLVCGAAPGHDAGCPIEKACPNCGDVTGRACDRCANYGAHGGACVHASEQMRSLLARYGVRSENGLVRKIRDEYERETGERPIRVVAEVILDGMLEAEYQRIEGGSR